MNWTRSPALVLSDPSTRCSRQGFVVKGEEVMSFHDLERQYFRFDSALGAGTTQQEVYDLAVAPCVGDVFEGVNATVMVHNHCFHFTPSPPPTPGACRHDIWLLPAWASPFQILRGVRPNGGGQEVMPSFLPAVNRPDPPHIEPPPRCAVCLYP